MARPNGERSRQGAVQGPPHLRMHPCPLAELGPAAAHRARDREGPSSRPLVRTGQQYLGGPPPRHRIGERQRPASLPRDLHRTFRQTSTTDYNRLPVASKRPNGSRPLRVLSCAAGAITWPTRAASLPREERMLRTSTLAVLATAVSASLAGNPAAAQEPLK